MKKMIGILLSVLFIVSLVGCNASAQSNQKDTEPTAEPVVNETAKDKLNEDELLLYEALIKITTDNFYEPSAVRLLNVEQYFHYNSSSECSTTVIVKLQGENKVGGTLNRYYNICIVASGKLSDTFMDSYNSAMEDYKLFKLPVYYVKAMNVKADFAEFCELSDNDLESVKNSRKGTYESANELAKEKFDVGRINRALKEYWEDMGF